MDQLTGNFTDNCSGNRYYSRLDQIYRLAGRAAGCFSLFPELSPFISPFFSPTVCQLPAMSFSAPLLKRCMPESISTLKPIFPLAGFFADIFEGIKIAFFGIVVTIAALFVNFIPGIGQAVVFLLYTYYSALYVCRLSSLTPSLVPGQKTALAAHQQQSRLSSWSSASPDQHDSTASISLPSLFFFHCLPSTPP